MAVPLDPLRLLDKTNDNSVHFLHFTRVYAKGNAVLFFEGDDDEKYYLSRIKTLTSNGFESIACSGKKSVIETREIINRHPDYGINNNLYFLDADFDDNSVLFSESDIYITPSYAIENFYVSSTCFELLLKAEFKCKDSIDKIEYESILEHFEISKNKFLDIISEFNYFVHAYRNTVKDNESCKLNLKGLDQSKKFIIMNFDKCNKEISFNIEFDLQSIKNTFVNIKDDDINASLINIASSKEYLLLDRERLFRGKNLLWFLIKYLNILKMDCNSNNPVLFKKKRSCSLDFSISTAISILSQYADTPECLKEFILKHLQ